MTAASSGTYLFQSAGTVDVTVTTTGVNLNVFIPWATGSQQLYARWGTVDMTVGQTITFTPAGGAVDAMIWN